MLYKGQRQLAPKMSLRESHDGSGVWSGSMKCSSPTRSKKNMQCAFFFLDSDDVRSLLHALRGHFQGPRPASENEVYRQLEHPCLAFTQRSPLGPSLNDLAVMSLVRRHAVHWSDTSQAGWTPGNLQCWKPLQSSSVGKLGGRNRVVDRFVRWRSCELGRTNNSSTLAVQDVEVPQEPLSRSHMTGSGPDSSKPCPKRITRGWLYS